MHISHDRILSLHPDAIFTGGYQSNHAGVFRLFSCTCAELAKDSILVLVTDQFQLIAEEICMTGTSLFLDFHLQACKSYAKA